MTLGDLIRELEKLPANMIVRIDYGTVGPYEEGEAPRGRREPGQLHSYRGDYAQLALASANGSYGNRPTVASLLEEARLAVGKAFEGYKGGMFTMTVRSPIWIADVGEYTGWALMAIDEVDSNDEHPSMALIRVMDIGEYR